MFISTTNIIHKGFSLAHISLHVLPAPVLAHKLARLATDLFGPFLVCACAPLWVTEEEGHDIVYVGIICLDRLTEYDKWEQISLT